MVFIVEYMVRNSSVGRAVFVASDYKDCEAKLFELVNQEELDFLVTMGFKINQIFSENSLGFDQFAIQYMDSFNYVFERIKRWYTEEVIKDIII